MNEGERPRTTRWNPAAEAEDAKRSRRIIERYQEAEKILADAASPESLEGNPYRGKPLNLESNPYEREWGMAFRMLKSAGVTLPWIQERAEIIKEKRDHAWDRLAYRLARREGVGTPSGTAGRRRRRARPSPAREVSHPDA